LFSLILRTVGNDAGSSLLFGVVIHWRQGNAMGLLLSFRERLVDD